MHFVRENTIAVGKATLYDMDIDPTRFAPLFSLFIDSTNCKSYNESLHFVLFC